MAGGTRRSWTTTSAAWRRCTARNVSSSGSPGPAPTSDTRPARAASHGGAAATRRDGDRHVAAPHQGWRDEVAVGNVVDGQHGDAQLAGLVGDARVQVAIVGRTEGQGRAREITMSVVTRQPLE